MEHVLQIKDATTCTNYYMLVLQSETPFPRRLDLDAYWYAGYIQHTNMHQDQDVWETVSHSEEQAYSSWCMLSHP